MESIAAWASRRSVTSKAAISALSPRLRRALAAVSRVSGLRPLTTTVLPASANHSAVAKPSPREAPVTSAMRPSSENSELLAPIRHPQLNLLAIMRALKSRARRRLGQKPTQRDHLGYFPAQNSMAV